MTFDIRGTRVCLGFSFVLVLTLMLLFCREDIVIACLIASLLHECGHMGLMIYFGDRISLISFGAFGVRIERHSSAYLSYKKETLIAAGGIIINFLLAFLSVLYYYLMKSERAIIFALVNVLPAMFNSLPLEALDMGRVIRYALLARYSERRCEGLLRIISVVTVCLLAALCFAYTAVFGVNVSLIAVTSYLFVITLFKKWS